MYALGGMEESLIFSSKLDKGGEVEGADGLGVGGC